MRAVTFDRYTDSSGLVLRDVDIPPSAEARVLVRIEAAGLNPFDWHMYRGEPWIMRATEGWRVRHVRTVGADIAGVVESVGPQVEGFSPGDRVLGSIGQGGLADFASARASSLTALPGGVSMTDAAAAPMAALTALQALRDAGSLRAGDRVLVWGASGGVGHLAVQIARILGATRVDGVCSAASAPVVQRVGVDAVYDYANGPLPDGPYDLVLDTVSTRSVRELKPLLAPGGRIVTVGSVSREKTLGPAATLLTRMIAGRVQRVATKGVLAKTNAADLALIAGWLAGGSLRPVVQETFPLHRFADALALLEAGHVRGKLVVQVAGSGA